MENEWLDPWKQYDPWIQFRRTFETALVFNQTAAEQPLKLTEEALVEDEGIQQLKDKLEREWEEYDKVRRYVQNVVKSDNVQIMQLSKNGATVYIPYEEKDTETTT